MQQRHPRKRHILPIVDHQQSRDIRWRLTHHLGSLDQQTRGVETRLLRVTPFDMLRIFPPKSEGELPLQLQLFALVHRQGGGSECRDHLVLIAEFKSEFVDAGQGVPELGHEIGTDSCGLSRQGQVFEGIPVFTRSSAGFAASPLGITHIGNVSRTMHRW